MSGTIRESIDGMRFHEFWGRTAAGNSGWKKVKAVILVML
jgi:hypothetical protein